MTKDFELCDPAITVTTDHPLKQKPQCIYTKFYHARVFQIEKGNRSSLWRSTGPAQTKDASRLEAHDHLAV